MGLVCILPLRHTYLIVYGKERGCRCVMLEKTKTGRKQRNKYVSSAFEGLREITESDHIRIGLRCSLQPRGYIIVVHHGKKNTLLFTAFLRFNRADFSRLFAGNHNLPQCTLVIHHNHYYNNVWWSCSLCKFLWAYLTEIYVCTQHTNDYIYQASLILLQIHSSPLFLFLWSEWYTVYRICLERAGTKQGWIQWMERRKMCFVWCEGVKIIINKLIT